VIASRKKTASIKLQENIIVSTVVYYCKTPGGVTFDSVRRSSVKGRPLRPVKEKKNRKKSSSPRGRIKICISPAAVCSCCCCAAAASPRGIERKMVFRRGRIEKKKVLLAAAARRSMAAFSTDASWQ
jgi:hypothetical protein